MAQEIRIDSKGLLSQNGLYDTSLPPFQVNLYKLFSKKLENLSLERRKRIQNPTSSYRRPPAAQAYLQLDKRVKPYLGDQQSCRIILRRFFLLPSSTCGKALIIKALESLPKNQLGFPLNSAPCLLLYSGEWLITPCPYNTRFCA